MNFLGQKYNKNNKGRRNTSLNSMEEVQNLVMLSLVPAQQYTGTVESSFICYVPYGSGTRLDAGERSLRNGNTRPQQLFQSRLLRRNS